jgi:gliding motility-associated lipoprotein GldH
MMQLRIQAIKLLSIALFFFLLSCEKSTYYSKIYSFENSTWKANDLKTFDVEITDNTKIYDIVFFVRVGTDYNYNNAWVYLHSTLPDKSTYREAHQFFISNDLGEWLGNKSGSLVESEMVFGKRKFDQVGHYKFVIEQATTQKELKYVSDLGLKIVESKQRK